METYDPQNYHPECYPDFDEPTRYLNPKLVKSSLRREVDGTHPMLMLLKIKPEIAASIIENNVRTQLFADGNLSTEEQSDAIVDYQVHMFTRLTILEVVEVMPLKYPFLVRHSMMAPDRLGNPNIDFPIAHAFGD